MNHTVQTGRTAGARALAVFTLIVATVSCDKPAPVKIAPDTAPPATAAQAGALEAPRIPSEPAKFGPTLARTVPEEHYDVDLHTEVDLCSRCHAEIADQWQDSVHAFASLANPFFRVSFDSFVKDAGADKAQFCSGCHDPSMTFDGSITQPISPKDRRAHMGVTCTHCHGIVEATVDGNASHVLSTAPIPIPTPGDAQSLEKHLARVGKPVLRTNELCMSCHRGFLSPATGHDVVIAGVNEITPYKNSRYGGSNATRIDSGVEETSCTSCHMPKFGDRQLSSHRFAGGHATFAAAIGSEAQMEAVTKMIQGAVTMHVGAVGVGDVRIADPPKAVKPGQTFWADVVVFNEATGHQFPGGALDLRDTWIEVQVTDGKGKQVAAAGTEHEESGADTSAMVLRAVLASDEGEIVKRHRVRSFRAAVSDYSISPRDALVARYTWQVPDPAPPLPFKVTARLRHRRVHEPLRTQACDEFKTERGQEFARYTEKYTKRKVDPCIVQPIVEVGSAWATLGDDTRSDSLPTWRRHYERGLGLLHNVQENLPEAIDAFERAFEALGADADKTDRARIHFARGVAAGAQGRIQDAMDQWALAEELVGEQASIHFARGGVHQRTFHNEEAKMWFLKASKLVDDDRVWRALAISAGSVGDSRTAYDAARAGLLLEPRDPHLLRNQMLALRKIQGADPAWVKLAADAFSAYKRDEMAAAVRDKCSESDPDCRSERQPMQVKPLR